MGNQQCIEENEESINMLKHFERSVMNKQYMHAMIMMDELCTEIDFMKHYFINGDTVIHYAIRMRNIQFLIYLLHKGYDVCTASIYISFRHLFLHD